MDYLLDHLGLVQSYTPGRCDQCEISRMQVEKVPLTLSLLYSVSILFRSTYCVCIEP